MYDRNNGQHGVEIMGNFIIRSAWFILILTFLFWDVDGTTIFESIVAATINILK